MDISRRTFLKGCTAAIGAASAVSLPISAMATGRLQPEPGADGDVYIPYGERTGGESMVWFTRDLSASGLRNIFARVRSAIHGKTAVKLHTGERNGPNIIPASWVRELFEHDLPGAAIVETNAYYQGDRYTTSSHRETVRANGWTFSPVDILDENGTAMLPVRGGKWFSEISVGRGLLSYDSLLVLSHFKGHAMGGFGGSNKNIGIGCADGRIGKAMIHTRPGEGKWSITAEEFMERMTESTKAVLDHFAPRLACINVLRNMSVSCDCEGLSAAPVVTPDIGIVASLDVLAVDQASVDLVFALPEKDRTALVERMSSRRGFRQLSCMKELSMGNDCYRLIDIDDNDARIMPKDAVRG